MTISQKGKILIVVGLLVACGVFFAASVYVKNVQSKYVAYTQALINKQEDTLVAMAQQIQSEAGDEVVTSVIKDCDIENRIRFDELLGKLAQLRGAELREVEQLFNACGDYFALKQAVMIIRFEREFEVYRDLVEVLTLAHPKADGITYDVEKWQRIVSLEKQRSELSTKLVNVQGEIITLLIEGTPVSSESVQELLAQGQDARVQLVMLAQQIAEVH